MLFNPPSDEVQVTLEKPTLSAAGSLGGEVGVSGTEVSHVEVYLDSQLIQTESKEPYTFYLDHLPAGEYTLYARTFSKNGDHGSSTP